MTENRKTVQENVDDDILTTHIFLSTHMEENRELLATADSSQQLEKREFSRRPGPGNSS
jgi:hypothetical protein